MKFTEEENGNLTMSDFDYLIDDKEIKKKCKDFSELFNDIDVTYSYSGGKIKKCTFWKNR